MSKVLVIDDDPAIGRSLQLQLEDQGCQVAVANTGAAGLERAGQFHPDLVFLDLQLPDRDGLDLIQELSESSSRPAVVVITGRQDMQATITAIRRGALDYIRKPLDLDEILLSLEKVSRQNSERGKTVLLSGQEPPRREIIGKSRAIIQVLKQVAQFSEVHVGVLIEGESGTGKELVARALHEASGADRPLVAVNCAALAQGVFESEMFGHERGAFTGADRQHHGHFEVAQDGSVFLDEIGELPLEMQAKLLRVLQEKEYQRVGGSALLPFRARIIAATHRDLHAMVEQGSFRDDLLHRLEVAKISVPPLRAHIEDLPLLAEALLNRISNAFGRSLTGISERALERLRQHHWPGNVRELENVLMRSVASCRADVLSMVDLPEPQSADRKAQEQLPGWRLQDAERHHVRQALARFDWNISQTARALEVSPTTLRKKIKDYDLRPDDPA